MPNRPKLHAAVTTHLECAHRDVVTGGLHGHSYIVEVWFKAGPNLDMVKAAILPITSLVDHTELETSVGGQRMEDIALFLMPRLKLIGNAGLHITGIRISRPTLGYIVELLA